MEAFDRTVEEGKYYLKQEDEMPFWKVVEILDEKFELDVPDHVDDVKNPLQKVTLELVYEAGNDEQEVPKSYQKDTVAKFVLETESQPDLTYGEFPMFVEAPPIPFMKVEV